VFDGTVDFNAVANEAAKAEGIELQEDIHLKADAAPIEGLARTQYEGSGMFKLKASEEQAPPPPAPELEEAPPSVDLPLIMPEDLEAPVARKTSLPKPPPPAPEPVRVSAPPAAVALSDDDGAADTTALSQAEPVVTETMAELYLKQGHQEDALRVYEALLTQRPGDARLQAKVDELSGRAAPVASVPVVGAAPAAAAAPARRQLARAASGQSAPEFLRRVLRGEAVAGAPAPPVAAAQGSALESAFASVSAEAAPEVEPAEPPGAPTQPADDNISLDAVFGDQVGRASGAELPSAPAPAAGPGGGTGGFSFDDFFGAQPSAGGQTSPAQQKPPSSGRTTRQPADDEDLDQFQSWLKGLKS
ncbi:MAG: hypothetical protein HYS40_01390, partial [Gemmatimonadetes bacterium]|nr:hypothetical protein [Gemmatimonadota bacterium]